MKRVPTNRKLSAFPTGGLVEIFQDQSASHSNDASQQYLDLTAFATAAQGALGDSASQSATMVEGSGISDGTGTVFKSSVETIGDLVRTTVFLDVTDLEVTADDLDVVGTGVSAAYLFQVTAAVNGTIFDGSVRCLEVPAGAADDLDFYAADENTGVFGTLVTDMTETALLTKGGAWAAGITPTVLSALPAANQYIYLTAGEAAGNGTFTAGQFLIELWGYK